MQSNQDKAGKKIQESENVIKDNMEQINNLILRLRISAELVKYYELQRYAKHRQSLEEDNQPTLLSINGEDELEKVEIVENQVISILEHTRAIYKKENHIDYSSLPHEEMVNMP